MISPWVIAGQDTCGLEVFADCPPLDAVVGVVGGGGLIASYPVRRTTPTP